MSEGVREGGRKGGREGGSKGVRLLLPTGQDLPGVKREGRDARARMVVERTMPHTEARPPRTCGKHYTRIRVFISGVYYASVNQSFTRVSINLYIYASICMRSIYESVNQSSGHLEELARLWRAADGYGRSSDHRRQKDLPN